MEQGLLITTGAGVARRHPDADPLSGDGEAVFRVKDLSFSYPGRLVLSGVSFDAPSGQWMAILGPNGAGKSTLLKLLYGALRPESGTIDFSGKPLSSYHRTDLSRRLAVVPQDTTIHFPFLVEEVVMMGRIPHARGRWFDTRKDIEHVHQIMKLTGVDGLAGRRISTLSGGERQRVIVTRALAQSPAALLLDEPTAFLDIRHKIEICELLRSLNQRKALTLVTVFHDINLAAQYCSRLVFIREGRIVCFGPPDDLINEAVLEKVYDVKVGVKRLNGIPFVFPRSSRVEGRHTASRKGEPGEDEEVT